MVDVKDFFAKRQRPTRRQTEVIDLDSDNDDFSDTTTTHKKRTKNIERVEQPSTETKVAPMKAKKTAVSPQEVLDSIPSVDLSKVHVKQNITFDFSKRGSSAEASSTGNGGSGFIPEDFPTGAPNCLLGLTIVFTGQLPNLERDTAESIAKRYGARVTKSISGRTSVVVLGEDAGPKKLEKIKQLKIKAIDEDGFRQLVSGMPAEGGDSVAAERERQKLKEQEFKAEREAQEMLRLEQERERETKAEQQRKGTTPHGARPQIKREDQIRDSDKLWTVKYAPTNLQQICGNKGAVAKLKNWLMNWDTNKKYGFKRPGRDGTGIYRAAMLYGPPGIGKTTAAHLVAKELGYDILEQNASDVRSKSLLNEGVRNALDNMSIIGYFKHRYNVNDVNGKKFAIIMDEVDGMSGGDRGGVGQLAQFCRKTSTPMILICNERNLPKMRPFDRTCLEIQFRRPDANSVKARLMTIAIREGFKLDPNVVDKLVQTTRGDMRQIINLLSTVSTTSKTINFDNIDDISRAWDKDVALKSFDIAHRLFDPHIYTDVGAERFTLNDKIGLYFDDFDFTPLMIQENYINCRPTNFPPGITKELQLVSEAADLISLGDLVERKIRSTEQLWSLLPFHAVMSSVYPASKVAGHMRGRINFSAWLGQNSKTGKYYRLLQELYYHSRLSTSTDKLGLRMDYLPVMKDRLLTPLLRYGTEGISEVIQLLDDYYLTKEDWDTVMDFMIGSDRTEPLLKKIPTSVKSSFTRKYNSTTHPVSIYRTGSTSGVGNGSRSTVRPDFADIVDTDDSTVPGVATNGEGDGEEGAGEDDNDLKKDKLIKQKVRAKSKPTATKRKTAAGATGATRTTKRRRTISVQ